MPMDVLIVDDHPAMRTLLRTVLERAGAAVRDAGSGAEGLTLIAARTPDIILADQSMPGMDGLAFIAHVRESGCTAPVLMVTGRGDAASKQAAREAGAAMVLVKPISPRALLTAIEDVLGAPRA